MPIRPFVGLFLALALQLRTALPYSIGDVDKNSLSGIWRLTSLDEGGLPFEKKRRAGMFHHPVSPKTVWKLRGYLPMKEFTTYPRKKSEDAAMTKPCPKKKTELFLKLKDDYTFEQCTALQFSDGVDERLEMELENELSRRERETFVVRGTWDLVDGKLILAADRPEKKPPALFDDDGMDDGNESPDTILVGKVAVETQESLTENPALAGRDSSTEQSTRKRTIDIHLSVPKGKIKTGRYFYPKTHPSFFEQPIFKPENQGKFELKQVLGEHNAKLAEEGDNMIELFRKKDLVGKKFYLSTFPLPKRRKKFETWDPILTKFVQKEYEISAEEKAEEDLQPGKNMQVVAVELFANNTFSTLGGLGSSTVLRGKWSIIGDKRNKLWMMVYRFGFGRSVSGSTFSEGLSLTQNDEKCKQPACSMYCRVISRTKTFQGYWGTISEVESANDEKKIEVEGAVMVGWGLEPTTLGRYKMIEIEDEMLEEDDEEDDDDDEDDYIELSEEAVKDRASEFDLMLGTDSPDDHSSGEDGAFE